MIPNKIRPYVGNIIQKKDGENNIIEGSITCCNGQYFEIFVFGRIKHNIFSNANLYSNDGIIQLKIRCKKCGKIISIFDSGCDGYDHCEKKQYTNVLTNPFNCNKCHSNEYSLKVKYEYPNEQELKDLGITEIDNAFTWIWITLKCSKCGFVYKNFIDYETS